jgi:hypothetical protein
MMNLCANMLKTDTILKALITTLYTIEVIWRRNEAFKESR